MSVDVKTSAEVPDAGREMRRLKRELETLISEAEERRAMEGEKYCPLISHDGVRA